MSPTIKLAKQLLSRSSVTPEDGGCQVLLAERLETIGFTALHLPYAEVKNLWITHGTGRPLFAFIGHTDVVPPGPLAQWNSDPFKPEIRNGFLYGRGAADMKGSIAAMVTAAERLIAENPSHKGTIAFLITSDEEGLATNGTRKVIEYLEKNNIKIDWCLVGEPSSEKRVGDVIKHGRRGSLNGKLLIQGVQGHIAYPHLAENPVHQASPALNELCTKVWGDKETPLASFQISNIQAGTGADNVIPSELEIIFNYRFRAEISEATLRQQTEQILDQHKLKYQLTWRLSGQPFLTLPDRLTDTVQEAVNEIVGYTAALSTTGGTSDGRFIAPTGAEVVELGPVNKTIHKPNECTNVAELDLLSKMYEVIMHKLLC